MVRRKNYLGFLKLHLITKHDILSAGVADASFSYSLFSTSEDITAKLWLA